VLGLPVVRPRQGLESGVEVTIVNRTRNARPLAVVALVLMAASCAHFLETTGTAQEKLLKTPAASSAPTPTAADKKSDKEVPRDKKAPAANRRDPPFQRLGFFITGADREPVFLDLDTHRWMTPPPDLLLPANKGKPIDQWVFPQPLQQWIHRNGIDLALQTDGHSLTVLGFDVHGGESFPANDHKNEAAIAQSVARAPADPAHWITLDLHLVWNTLSRTTRFVTREGGFGSFRLHVSGVLGPNTIHVDYDLSRGPEVAKLTGQPVINVHEPPIPGRLAGNPLVDVKDNKLRLRMLGGLTQIELAADQVIVREASHPELRATRLIVGDFEIDAAAGTLVVRGSKKATLRRVGDRVEISFDKVIPGRYQRNPDKRVAQAEQLTLMPGLTILEENKLDWATVKPSPELLKKQADERQKRYAAGEALYAELAAKHGYRLAPGQYIKRIPPPFAEPRDEYWRVTRPDQFFYLSSTGGAGPTAIGYLWDGKTLHEGPVGFLGAWRVIDVCHVLHQLKPQQISGPKNLLVTPLPGDWVYREGMTAEILVAQLEPILRQELKLPIHLEFGEKTQEVYVARGTWHMTPLSDTRVRSGGVQIYGKVLNFSPIGGSSGGGGGGGLTELLDAVGEWIDARIVRDNVANPPQRVTWDYHLAPHPVGRDSTADERRAARDPALVLHNIEVQTGLTFTKETRPVKLLFVENKPLTESK
jgi:hypothetical protein